MAQTISVSVLIPGLRLPVVASRCNFLPGVPSARSAQSSSLRVVCAPEKAYTYT